MVRWIVGIVCSVVALAVLGLVFIGVRTKLEEEKYTVTLRELGRHARGLGKVESRIPEQELGFVISGRLKDVYVVEGQSVKAGDELAALERPDFEARIAAAKAALVEAQAKEKLVTLGPRPEEYKPLAERVLLTEKEIEIAKAKLEQLKNPVNRPVLPTEIELAQLEVNLLAHQSREATFQQQKVLAGPTEDELAISDAKWSLARLDHRDAKDQYDIQVKEGWPGTYGKRKGWEKIAAKNQIERADIRQRIAQTEHDMLKKGATKAERDAAGARDEAARAAYDIASAKLRHLEKPPPPPPSTKHELQLAKLNVEKAEAAQREAQATLARAKLLPREEELAVAKAAVTRAQKALDEIQALGDQGKLLAPSDGTILERYHEPGSVLLPGIPVVRLGNTKDFRVRAEINAESSAQLRPGQVVMLLGNFLSGGPLPGKIERVLPTAGPKRLFSEDPREVKGGQVVELLIEIDPVKTEAATASYSALRPGIRLDIQVDFDAQGKVLVVPKGFVRYDNNKYFVQLADPNSIGPDGKVGKTEEREIDVGWRDEMNYVVTGGIQEHDILVRPPSKP
jgi:multidrug efflux pump subunit AcrA (membrane-fusion protein)